MIWLKSISLHTNCPWMKGIQVFSLKGSCSLQRGDNHKNVKIVPGPLKKGDNHKNVNLGWGH
jgi:hypothetical protein